MSMANMTAANIRTIMRTKTTAAKSTYKETKNYAHLQLCYVN